MMRWKLLVLAGACAMGAAGCHCCKCDKVQTGWRFEVIRPPIVEQSAPMLVQQTPGYVTAQPIGTVAGPIAGGQFQTSPGVQLVPQSAPCTPPPLSVQYQQPQAAPQSMPQAAPCTQAPQAAQAPQMTMTCEEWCALMAETARQRRLPMPFKVPAKDKGKED